LQLCCFFFLSLFAGPRGAFLFWNRNCGWSQKTMHIYIFALCRWVLLRVGYMC
jgi:hypothetical protein